MRKEGLTLPSTELLQKWRELMAFLQAVTIKASIVAGQRTAEWWIAELRPWLLKNDWILAFHKQIVGVKRTEVAAAGAQRSSGGLILSIWPPSTHKREASLTGSCISPYSHSSENAGWLFPSHSQSSYTHQALPRSQLPPMSEESSALQLCRPSLHSPTLCSAERLKMP